MNNTRAIDTESEKILSAFIPNEWLIRKQIPDIHIDYRIEIAGLEPEGLNFCVQLKGHKNPKIRNNCYSEQMKSKHLTYYADKVKEPVFLFYINNSSKDIYWIFLQEYLLCLPTDEWRKQKTYSIKIPIQNKLDNASDFLPIVEKSELFMRDRWPASIQPTMHFHQKQLSNIDPRFGVNISYNNGQTFYEISAKSKVKVDFKFKNIDKNSLSRLLSHGETISIPSGGLHIDGSALFDFMMKDCTGDVKLSFQKHLPIDVVAHIANTNHEIITGFKGAIDGGLTHYRLEIKLPKSPFVCSIGLYDNNGIIKFDDNANFGLEFDEWNKYNVSELPYINQVALIIQAFKNGNDIKFDINSNGKFLFSFNIAANINTNNDNYFRYILLLQMLNCICGKFKVDYRFVDIVEISDRDALLICKLYEFIENGCMQMITPKATAVMTLLLTAKLYKSLKENPNRLDSIGDKGRDYNIQILDKNITIDNIECNFSNMRISSDLSILDENKIGQEYTIHLQGTDSTVNTVRKLTE